MQITKTDIDQLNAKLTLVVEPADYEEKVAKELRNIRQKAQIPGFRPGKVPASLIQKQYGKAVLAEEMNKVIGEGLYGYIQENKLNILGEPLSNEEETPDYTVSMPCEILPLMERLEQRYQETGSLK